MSEIFLLKRVGQTVWTRSKCCVNNHQEFKAICHHCMMQPILTCTLLIPFSAHQISEGEPVLYFESVVSGVLSKTVHFGR